MENVSRPITTPVLGRSLEATLEQGGIPDKSGGRVLLAGQAGPATAAISSLVSRTNHRLLRAHSVEETLALLSSASVDLILADNSLQGLSAIDLCGLLKRSPATQLLPAFILWARNNPEAEAKAIEAGADAFLPMPIEARLFHAHLNSALRRKALVDKLDDSESILFSLAASVEERHGALGQHCERLARIASSIGLALQLPAEDIRALQRGGYLHDIGKVAIPDQVLFKRGPLTAEEWRIMERHTVKGEQICQGMRSLRNVLPIIRHHHERWDGSGYPDHLRGDEIPLLARIVQLADIYDALTAERSYKPAMSPDEAVQVIREETKRGWRDPFLTEQFADMLPSLATLDGTNDAEVSQLSLQALATRIGFAQRLIPAIQQPSAEPIDLQAR